MARRPMKNCGEKKEGTACRALREEGVQKPQLAAIYRGVAHVLALDDVDYVFGDVGGVVPDAF